MWCSSIQCIYAQLTGGSICLLYICIVLDLPVGVAVCKASVLNWLGGHLPSIYMHCPRCSNCCSGMQGICAQLTGEDLCLIALCYANIFGVAVFNSSMLDWLGGSICFLYICIVWDLTVGVVLCKTSVLKWLGGWGSICLLYICIVLDLAVDVVVCKASVLNWLGRTYAQLHCAMLIYLV